MTSVRTRFALLTLGGLVVAGCTRNPVTRPVYDPQTRALVRIDYDYDADGRVDVRTYMKNGKATRLEGDADQDGMPDRWEYYDAEGRLERVGGSTAHDGIEDTWAYESNGEVRVDISTHRDGTVDRREFYRADTLLRTESDTNEDGVMDTWEQYQNGQLAAVLLDDEKHSGRPTRRLVYGAGGAVRVEVDPDGDGVFVAASGAGGESHAAH